MTNDELAQLVLETADGLTTALQLLVMSLAQTGHMDDRHYARLLADYRNTECPGDSMKADVLDRLLGMLADDPQVLRRRLAMQLVRDAPATSSDPGPPDGNAP